MSKVFWMLSDEDFPLVERQAVRHKAERLLDDPSRWKWDQGESLLMAKYILYLESKLRINQMSHEFDTLYCIDLHGRLWKGPINPEENLHWARHEGVQGDGSECWVLRRSEKPDSLGDVYPGEERGICRLWTRRINENKSRGFDYISLCQMAKDSSRKLEELFKSTYWDSWQSHVAMSAILSVLLAED